MRMGQLFAISPLNQKDTISGFADTPKAFNDLARKTIMKKTIHAERLGREFDSHFGLY